MSPVVVIILTLEFLFVQDESTGDIIGRLTQYTVCFTVVTIHLQFNVHSSLLQLRLTEFIILNNSHPKQQTEDGHVIPKNGLGLKSDLLQFDMPILHGYSCRHLRRQDTDTA